MADSSSWQNTDDDLFSLPAPDELAVLSSTRSVVEQGEHVWINREQLDQLCQRWLLEEESQAGTLAPAWYDQYHFFDDSERTVNWLLVLDALNFCFWGDKGQPRWSIDYDGTTLNGYWAEAAALTRAVEEGIPLWDAEYLRTISSETVAHIFRGTQTIPLFEERVAHLHEVGRVLLERYDGQFARAIEQTHGSALQLALLLVRDFPSFNDVAIYRGRPVRFYKRAQICVADLWGSFHGEKWGRFTDLDQLTAYADYKLPQVLRHYNVLEYAPSLAETVDNQELIPSGSEEEIEIRANTLWACELLRRALLKYGVSMNNAAIDQRLWTLGQSSDDMRPYHRTRTIYY